MIKQVILNRLSKIGQVKKYYSGIATIFMLHRVSPLENNKLLPNENMKISPEFLDKLIMELIANGYEFISLDRLYQILQNKEKVKKKIIFTLDDGYKDNYTIAYPIFKKHNIPFTVYVTTSFPEKSAILWWYILEELLVSNNEIIMDNGDRYSCRTIHEKINAFLQIRDIVLSFRKKDFFEKINKMFSNYKIDWYRKTFDLAMDWDEIIKLSQDDIVTIASHTKNHYALNRLTEDEIKEEILEANILIESKINKKIDHFAFPFGSRNEIRMREFEIIKNFNFKTVTTTRRGNIYLEHKDYLNFLPRIMLTEDFNIKDIGNIRRKKVVTL